VIEITVDNRTFQSVNTDKSEACVRYHVCWWYVDSGVLLAASAQSKLRSWLTLRLLWLPPTFSSSPRKSFGDFAEYVW